MGSRVVAWIVAYEAAALVVCSALFASKTLSLTDERGSGLAQNVAACALLWPIIVADVAVRPN